VRKPVSVLLALVFAVSVVVEWFRYLIYSGEYGEDPQLWLISVGAVAINLGYHRWVLPETLPKVIVSAAFTQAGLPIVYYVVRDIVLVVAKRLVTSPKG